MSDAVGIPVTLHYNEDQGIEAKLVGVIVGAEDFFHSISQLPEAEVGVRFPGSNTVEIDGIAYGVVKQFCRSEIQVPPRNFPGFKQQVLMLHEDCARLINRLHNQWCWEPLLFDVNDLISSKLDAEEPVTAEDLKQFLFEGAANE